MIVADVVKKYKEGQEIFRRRSVDVLLARIEELEKELAAQQSVQSDEVACDEKYHETALRVYKQYKYCGYCGRQLRR